MSMLLLVDDEPDMKVLVNLCLAEADVDVVQVGTGSDALAAASRERPRLVLLDIGLGDEDGLEVLPRLRSEPALDGVPILVFSVHDSRRREAIQLGADGFVGKPFGVEELRSALRPHLG